MPRYLKKDSELGYIEDYAEIEYLKFNNMRHTILGCMLGDFDEDGRYVVDPEIVSELIAMRKYVIETMDNIEICLSELKLDKQISFSVTFEGNSATLCLIEKLNYEGNFKINSGAYSNINEYVLDVVETSGVIDKSILYKRWNISEYGGSVLDIFNMDEETLAKYFGLVNRFKYLMKANQIFLEQEERLESAETDYIIDLLEQVNRFPKLKELVNAQLKQELADKKNIICVDKPNFAKTLNEVVTQVVNNNTTVLDEAERADFDTAKHQINNDYNIKVRDIVDIKHERVSGQGEEYVKYTLDTHRVEESESVLDSANGFVKAQQESRLRARTLAVLSYDKLHGGDILKDIDEILSTERLRKYILERLDYDIHNNVAIPFERKLVNELIKNTETKVEAKADSSAIKTPTKQTVKKGTEKSSSEKGGKKEKNGGKETKKPSNTSNVKKPQQEKKTTGYTYVGGTRQAQETSPTPSRNVIPDSKKRVVVNVTEGKVSANRETKVSVERASREDVINQFGIIQQSVNARVEQPISVNATVGQSITITSQTIIGTDVNENDSNLGLNL